jgi:hypothetical protein
MPDAPRTRGPLTPEQAHVLKERRKVRAEEEAAHAERERAEVRRHPYHRETDKNFAQQVHDKRKQADRPDANRWQVIEEELHAKGEAHKLHKQAKRAAQAKHEKGAEVLVQESDEDEDEEGLADQEQEEGNREAAKQRAGGAPRVSDNEATRLAAGFTLGAGPSGEKYTQLQMEQECKRSFDEGLLMTLNVVIKANKGEPRKKEEYENVPDRREMLISDYKAELHKYILAAQTRAREEGKQEQKRLDVDRGVHELAGETATELQEENRRLREQLRIKQDQPPGQTISKIPNENEISEHEMAALEAQGVKNLRAGGHGSAAKELASSAASAEPAGKKPAKKKKKQVKAAAASGAAPRNSPAADGYFNARTLEFTPVASWKTIELRPCSLRPARRIGRPRGAASSRRDGGGGGD